MDSLKLYDLSDRELLHVVMDEQDAEGWTASTAIADRLGITHRYPNQCVGTRMSWMKRYGVVEKHPTRHAWKVSRSGQTLMNGDLTASQKQTLDAMDSARVLMLTRWLTGRYRRSGESAGHLYRREWNYGTRRN